MGPEQSSGPLEDTHSAVPSSQSSEHAPASIPAAYPSTQTQPVNPNQGVTIMMQSPPTPAAPPPPKKSRHIGRRVFLAASTVGLCAGAAVLTPMAAQQVTHDVEAQVKHSFEQGITQGIAKGRQDLLDELAQIEGVSLDVAIDVAEITRLGVLYILVPLARLSTTLIGDALQIMLDAVNQARNVLGVLRFNTDTLTGLAGVLTSWHENIALLPKKLSDYITADITSSESYLRALKRKIAAETAAAHATPTATP